MEAKKSREGSSLKRITPAARFNSIIIFFDDPPAPGGGGGGARASGAAGVGGLLCGGEEGTSAWTAGCPILCDFV